MKQQAQSRTKAAILVPIRRVFVSTLRPIGSMYPPLVGDVNAHNGRNSFGPDKRSGQLGPGKGLRLWAEIRSTRPQVHTEPFFMRPNQMTDRLTARTADYIRSLDTGDCERQEVPGSDWKSIMTPPRSNTITGKCPKPEQR